MAPEPLPPRRSRVTVRAGPDGLGYSRFKWVLVGLAIALTAAFFVFFAVNARQAADQAERSAEREMGNLAALLSDQANQAFAGVRLTLSALATDATDPALWADRTALRELLVRYLAIDGRIGRLMVLGIDGRVHASNDTAAEGRGVVEREFWEALVRAAPGETVLDRPYADPASGNWVVAAATGVRGRDGAWLGAVVAEVPREFFERLYARLDIGRRSAFGIVDRRGTLVARTPALDRIYGHSVVGTPFMAAAEAVLRGEGGTAARAVGFDGIERVFAFASVPGVPYFVYAGTSPEDYLADWRANVRVSLPFSALVLAIFIFLILALARHLGRLERSESSIRRSDARYQTLVANIPGIVFQRRREPDGRTAVVWMSDAALPLLGMTAAECVRDRGRPLRDATHPDDLRILLEAYERSAADMRAMHWTGRMRHADGRERWFEIHARPRAEADGAVVWEGLVSDVTDRIAAENALASVRAQLDQKKAQLELALSNMAQGMCVYDRDLRLVVCNRRYLELYRLEDSGIGEGSTLEQTMRASVAVGNYTQERAEAVLRERLESASRNEPRSLIQRLETGRIIEVDSRPLEGGGSVATFTDVTDRESAGVALRQAKEQAELADRAKSQFLANMSHELRTPLNAIIGFAEIMTDKLFGPIGDPRYEEYARDIRESGRHLLTLINDILDLSKIEARQANLREEQVEIADLFTACARLVSERAQRAGVDLDVMSAEAVPAVWADRVKLKQILLNLLSNAIKFTPAGGTVRMTAARTPAGDVALAVADTGIGMRAQDIPLALQPFRQIESTLARRHEGTGLGLPLTKAIVEMHGGTLAIVSTPGGGTTVTATLPAERVIDPHGVQDAQLAEAINAARSAL